jgi:hypothetical protein
MKTPAAWNLYCRGVNAPSGTKVRKLPAAAKLLCTKTRLCSVTFLWPELPAEIMRAYIDAGAGAEIVVGQLRDD